MIPYCIGHRSELWYIELKFISGLLRKSLYHHHIALGIQLQNIFMAKHIYCKFDSCIYYALRGYLDLAFSAKKFNVLLLHLFLLVYH